MQLLFLWPFLANFLAASLIQAASTSLSLDDTSLMNDKEGRIYRVQQTGSLNPDQHRHLILDSSLWTLKKGEIFCWMEGNTRVASAQKIITETGEVLFFQEHQKRKIHFHGSDPEKPQLTWGPFIFKGEGTLSLYGGDVSDIMQITSPVVTFEKNERNIPLRFLKDFYLRAKQVINHAFLEQIEGKFTSVSKEFWNYGTYKIPGGIFGFEEGHNKEGAAILGNAPLHIMGREERKRFLSFKNEGRVSSKVSLDLKGESYNQTVTGMLFAGVYLNADLDGPATFPSSIAGKLLAGYCLSLTGNRLTFSDASIRAHTLILGGRGIKLDSKCELFGENAISCEGQDSFFSEAQITLINSGGVHFPYHLFWEGVSEKDGKSRHLKKWVDAYIKKKPLKIPFFIPGLSIAGTTQGYLGGKIDVRSGRTSVEGIGKIGATFYHEQNPIYIKGKNLKFFGEMNAMFASFQAEQGILEGVVNTDQLLLEGTNFILSSSSKGNALATNLKFLEIQKTAEVRFQDSHLTNRTTFIAGLLATSLLSESSLFSILPTGIVYGPKGIFQHDFTRLYGLGQFGSITFLRGTLDVSGTFKTASSHGYLENMHVYGSAETGDTHLTVHHLETLPNSHLKIGAGYLNVDHAVLHENISQGHLQANLLETHMPHFMQSASSNYRTAKTFIYSPEVTFCGNAELQEVMVNSLKTTITPGAQISMGSVNSLCPIWDVGGSLHAEYFESHSPVFYWRTRPGGRSDITTAIIGATKGIFFGENYIRYLQWKKGHLSIESHSHLYSSYIEALGGSLMIKSEGGLEAEAVRITNRAMTVEAGATAKINQAQIKTISLQIDGNLHVDQGSLTSYQGQVTGRITGRALEGNFTYFDNQGDIHASHSLQWRGGYYTSSGIAGGDIYSLLDFDQYGNFGQFRDSQQLSIRIDDRDIIKVLREFDQKAFSNLEIITNKCLVLDEDVHLQNPLTLTADSLCLSSQPHSYTSQVPWGKREKILQYYTPQRHFTSESMLRLRARQGNLSFINVNVMAKDLFLESSHNTFIEDSDLKGTRFLHLEIEGDLFLKRMHKPASLTGGTGITMLIGIPAEDSFGDAIWVDGKPRLINRRENVGLWVSIGGGLYVDASDLLSVGSIYVQARKGVQVMPRFVEHITERIKRNWYGKKTVTRTGWTEVIKSNIGSAEGSIYFIILEEGSVFQATNVVGNNKIMVMAQKGVQIQDAITQFWRSRKTKALGGFIKSSQYSSQEQSHPTVIASVKDNIQVISTEGSIHGQGAIFYTPKHLSIDAWNRVYLGIAPLQSYSVEKSQGFKTPRFSFMKLYDIATAESMEDAFSSFSLFTQKLDFLCKADNDFNKVSGMVSLCIEFYNMNALYEQLGGTKFLGNQLGFLDGRGELNPSVDLTHAESKVLQSCVSPGEGSVKAATGTLRSQKGDVDLHGLPVNIEDILKVKAPRGVFKQRGFESHHRQSYEYRSIGVTATALSGDIVGVTFSGARSDLNRTIQIPQVLTTRVLDLQANGYEQRSALAYLYDIRGQVGYIHSESVQDYIDESGFMATMGLSFGDGGALVPYFSFQTRDLEGRRVNQRSGLYIKDGRGQSLTVLNTLTAIGSEMEFGYTHVDAEDVLAPQIHDSVIGRSWGVGFTPGLKLHTINLQIGKQSYKTTQHASIGGDNIHNRSTGEAHVPKGPRGIEVHEDKNIQYRMDLPVLANTNDPKDHKKTPQNLKESKVLLKRELAKEREEKRKEPPASIRYKIPLQNENKEKETSNRNALDLYKESHFLRTEVYPAGKTISLSSKKIGKPDIAHIIITADGGEDIYSLIEQAQREVQKGFFETSFRGFRGLISNELGRAVEWAQRSYTEFSLEYPLANFINELGRSVEWVQRNYTEFSLEYPQISLGIHNTFQDLQDIGEGALLATYCTGGLVAGPLPCAMSTLFVVSNRSGFTERAFEKGVKGMAYCFNKIPGVDPTRSQQASEGILGVGSILVGIKGFLSSAEAFTNPTTFNSVERTRVERGRGKKSSNAWNVETLSPSTYTALLRDKINSFKKVSIYDVSADRGPIIDTVKVRSGLFLMQGKQLLRHVQKYFDLKTFHIESFEDGMGSLEVMGKNQRWYQLVSSEEHLSAYISRVPPTCPLQSMKDSAIKGGWNSMRYVREVQLNPEAVYIIGEAASQNSIETVWYKGRFYDVPTIGGAEQALETGYLLNKKSNLTSITTKETNWNVISIGSRPIPEFSPLIDIIDVTSSKLMEFLRRRQIGYYYFQLNKVPANDPHYSTLTPVEGKGVVKFWKELSPVEKGTHYYFDNTPANGGLPFHKFPANDNQPPPSKGPKKPKGLS